MFYRLLVVVILLTACSKNEEGPSYLNEEFPLVKIESTYKVIMKEDITYAYGLTHENWNSDSSKSKELKLDAYFPDNILTNRPIIVLIHGGGFNTGSRKNFRMMERGYYFASRGWVVFSIGYRLKEDRGTVPSEWINYAKDNFDISYHEDFYKIYPAVRDNKAAVRWIVSHADSLGINPQFITVGGSSAGAIVSIAIGVSDLEDFTNEIPSAEDPTLATTNINQAFRIKTIIDLWGSDEAVAALHKVYGYQRLTADDPPILIIHGEDDATIPISDAKYLRDKYSSMGINHAFYNIPEQGHSPWDATIDGLSLNQLTFNFIVNQQNLTVH